MNLPETSAGVYEGRIAIPASANIEGGSVLAQLTGPSGATGSSPLIQAAQTVTIDTKPPVVSGQSPATGSTVATNRPRVYAVTDDPNGSGVDAQSTRMTIDGRDVTANAIVTSNFITYQPVDPLSNGLHTAIVSVSDIVGNSAQKKWTFTVAPNQGLINDVSSNISDTNQTLAAGQPLNVTMHAQPGGSAAFSVGAIAKDIPMRETSAGVYTGTYIPAAGSSVQNAPVVTRFTSSNGTVVTSTLDQPVTIDAGQPVAPTVSSPVVDQAVGDTVTVSGKAAPGATVNISIMYKAKALGGLFSVGGKAADSQATADRHGIWTTQPLKLSSPGALASASSETFELTATTVDANGQQSDPTVVDFRHG